MNQSPTPGQPGAGAGQPNQGAPGAQQQQQPNQAQRAQMQFLRPEVIDRIPFLSAEDKVKYTNGLRQLWNNLETLPKDSAEAAATRNRIADFSRSLIAKTQAMTRQQQLQAAQAKMAQAQAQGQGGQGQGPPAQVPQHQQVQPQQQQRNLGAANTAGNEAQGGAGTTPVIAPAATPGQPANAQFQLLVNQVAAKQKFPDHILKHMAQMTYHVMQSMVPPGVDARQFQFDY